ncbi:MAG: phosphotransferase [Chloroflexi bacterium]|nr:phosphotransferase [Chloroflexota bacterium]
MIHLTVESAPAFLAARGWLRPDEPATAVALSGGVSCEVLEIATPTRRFIVKQALPAWRVEPPWPCRLDRSIRERECIDVLGVLLPPRLLPRVLAYDDASFCFAMDAFARGALTWKSHLLAGTIEPAIAVQAGSLLGAIHRATWGGASVPPHFADSAIFEQMRVDPYHRTIAAIHPTIAPVAERCAHALLTTKQALVHGDFAPKNILVVDGELRLLDFETAHLGLPIFDVAFCLSHLILKAVRFPLRRRRYLDLALSFHQAYGEALDHRCSADQTADLVAHLGCLLLARVDGRSRVEYITDEPTRDRVRRLALSLLQRPQSLNDALDAVDRDGALYVA